MMIELRTYKKQADGSMKLIETQYIEEPEPVLSPHDRLVRKLVEKGVITLLEAESLAIIKKL